MRCYYSPLYDLSSVLPASTAANYILVSAAGFALIRTGGVQSWSSHLGSFHLKLSAAFLFPSFSCSFAFLSSYSHSFSPILPHYTALFCFLSFLPLLIFFALNSMLSSSLLLFLLDWEEVTGLFVDPSGLDRWSSLSCNPFFIRRQNIATCRLFLPQQLAWYYESGTCIDYLRAFQC